MNAPSRLTRIIPKNDVLFFGGGGVGILGFRVMLSEHEARHQAKTSWNFGSGQGLGPDVSLLLQDPGVRLSVQDLTFQQSLSWNPTPPPPPHYSMPGFC